MQGRGARIDGLCGWAPRSVFDWRHAEQLDQTEGTILPRMAVSALLDFVCDKLQQSLTLVSLVLERSLSQLHSTIHTSISSLLGVNLDSATKTNRAWWNTEKGSAVVVWCPGDQTIAQALAISLASIPTRSRSSTRAGRPPYTVIIVLPSASSGLPSIISSWAARKAKLEDGRDGLRGRLRGASWGLFGFQSLSDRIGSPESTLDASVHEGEPARVDDIHHAHTRQASDSQDSDSQSPTSRPSTPGKRRRLSLGNWSASDVVGFGKDMLKGLRIGQAESQGIGAVIPIVADTSTLDGVTHAQSTIKAYCTSHDLLLRALIVVPSIMSLDMRDIHPHPISSSGEVTPRPVSSTSHTTARESLSMGSAMEKDDTVPTLSPSSLHRTQALLSMDVSETMGLVASLLPVLRTDGGRVVALVPSSWREVQSVRLHNERLGLAGEEGALEYRIVRKAVLEMWTGLRSSVGRAGISISQVHMSAMQPRQTGKSAKQPAAHRRLGDAAPRRAHQLILLLLNRLHFLLYPIPTQGSAASRETIDEPACPSLLLDAVRSALVRTWPRAHYCVGLGPRLEGLLEMIPFHDWLHEGL